MFYGLSCIQIYVVWIMQMIMIMQKAEQSNARKLVEKYNRREDWMFSFVHKNISSLRTPDATNIARAQGFSKIFVD